MGYALGQLAPEKTRQIPGIVGTPTAEQVAAWQAFISNLPSGMTPAQEQETLKAWTALLQQSPAGGGWLDQELIPGVANKWLLGGGLGFFVLMAVLGGRRRRR